MSFAGSKALGVRLTDISSTAEHELGACVRTEDGKEFMYIKAGGSDLAVYVPVKIATGYVCTASGNAGHVFGVPQTAITAAYYGWVQTKGVCTAHVTDAQAAGVNIPCLTDANGDLTAVVAGTTAGVRGVTLVTEDATDYVAVQLF